MITAFFVMRRLKHCALDHVGTIGGINKLTLIGGTFKGHIAQFVKVRVFYINCTGE